MSEENINRHAVVLGVNYATSTAALRDHLLFSPDDLPRGLEGLGHVDGVRECAILSTCNRVELYVVVDDPEPARTRIVSFLAGFHGIAQAQFADHVYYMRCDGAAEHLFHVAASLDSMVVGEAQILGQVKEAQRVAMEQGTTGPLLNKLFQFAVTAGKRARAETRIGEGSVSISLSAIEICRKVLGKLTGRTAMVIGAGEMGELSARHLREAGISRLYCANRSIERATDLAAAFEGTPLRLEHMSTVLHECDVVISSTAAPGVILTRSDVQEVMARRRNRPLVLVDIAAPRDIDSAAGSIYNVFLYTIDDLTAVAHDNAQARSAEVAKVREIIREEMSRYVTWYTSLRIQPVLVSLREKFERVRDAEVRRYASAVNTLPEPAARVFAEFAASLTNKFLHDPSTALREQSATPEGMQYAATLVRLFNLDGGA